MNKEIYLACRQIVLARLKLMGYSIYADYSIEDEDVVAVSIVKPDGSNFVYTLYPHDFMREHIVEHVVLHMNNMIIRS